jgi:hypothetical protein
MPTYTIKDVKENQEWEVICSWNELQQILDADQNLKQELATPMSVSMTGNTVSRTSGDWRDYLKKVKKESGKGDTINI